MWTQKVAAEEKFNKALQIEAVQHEKASPIYWQIIGQTAELNIFILM